jgi:hypothetical protein
MLYRHETIDKQKFEQYRLTFSPHCTVASLYIWAVAGGALSGMKEYAPKKKPVSAGGEPLHAVQSLPLPSSPVRCLFLYLLVHTA